jgi:hypothetical protein
MSLGSLPIFKYKESVSWASSAVCSKQPRCSDTQRDIIFGRPSKPAFNEYKNYAAYAIATAQNELNQASQGNFLHIILCIVLIICGFLFLMLYIYYRRGSQLREGSFAIESDEENVGEEMAREVKRLVEKKNHVMCGHNRSEVYFPL